MDWPTGTWLVLRSVVVKPRRAVGCGTGVGTGVVEGLADGETDGEADGEGDALTGGADGPVAVDDGATDGVGLRLGEGVAVGLGRGVGLGSVGPGVNCAPQA